MTNLVPRAVKPNNCDYHISQNREHWERLKFLLGFLRSDILYQDLAFP